MTYIRLIIKFILFLLHSLFFLLIGLVLPLAFLFVSKKNKRRFLSWLTKIWSISTLKILNVKIFADLTYYNKNETYLIVGNHLSWLDAVIFGSFFKAQFIAKKEIASWPIIGWLSKIGGTVFIDRTKITQGVKVASTLAKTLQLGSSVLIFPESKSSIGNKVLPFKPSLFLSAIEAGSKILPVTLDFGTVDGKPFVTDEDKIKFSYFDDMTFAPHFLKFLTFKSFTMKLITHPPIETTTGLDAKELALKSFQLVESGMESLKK